MVMEMKMMVTKMMIINIYGPGGGGEQDDGDGDYSDSCIDTDAWRQRRW